MNLIYASLRLMDSMKMIPLVHKETFKNIEASKSESLVKQTHECPHLKASILNPLPLLLYAVLEIVKEMCQDIPDVNFTKVF